MAKIIAVVVAVILLGTLTSCIQSTTSPGETASPATLPTELPTASPVLATPTVTTPPPRVLNICMGQEPASLFLYGDSSSTARGILQAIYDGPIDFYQFEPQAIILEKIPSLADGDASLRPVEVSAGELILDAQGNWVSLQEGVSYRPSGCTNPACAAAYANEESITMDELVVQFRIKPGIQWSDGMPLTAGDSVYSYEVFRSLYADALPPLLRYTRTYEATSELTVEWTGIPGYQSSHALNFFTPLPQHLWGALAASDLLTAEVSARMPIGWGPYVIDEWVAGDHLTLSRNQRYYRAAEGLPHFDHLVFRFVQDAETAIEALSIGECDLIDRTAALELHLARLLELEETGQLSLAFQTGTAWEQITFGLEPIDPQRFSLFQSKETRQAIAMCIDRQEIVDSLFFGKALIPDTYLPALHPLSNPELQAYVYDPEKAAGLLQLAGWMDPDQDSATPRVSAGVPNLADGTPLRFELLTSAEAGRAEAAQMIADQLDRCGVGVSVTLIDWQSLYQPGPEGAVFGRQFDAAQFAWAHAIEPTCSLFLSAEIPGPPSENSAGWGGANASGFRNADFDAACQSTLSLLPGTADYLAAHHQAQAIFLEQLPALPLYQPLKVMALRPDLCQFEIDPISHNPLSKLELLDYGDGCP